MTETVNLWDRFPNEPDLWYDRFDRFYRVQGPSRTLSEAYRQEYKERNGSWPERPGYTDSWNDAYKEWKWKERASAWDDHIRKEKVKAEEINIKEMSARHAVTATRVQKMALEKLMEGFADADMNTALRAWAKAVEIERTSRGIPDQLIKVQEMEADELRAEIARRLASASIREKLEGFESGGDESFTGTTDGGGEAGSSDTVSESDSAVSE